jgi:hypothetical protein
MNPNSPRGAWRGASESYPLGRLVVYGDLCQGDPKTALEEVSIPLGPITPVSEAER